MAKFYTSSTIQKPSGVKFPHSNTEADVNPAIVYSWPMTSLKILPDISYCIYTGEKLHWQKLTTPPTPTPTQAASTFMY